MTLNLITEEEYNLILDIFHKYPVLTYQNRGYDYPDKSKWNEEEIANFNIVSDILKKAIVGFSEFNNFKVSIKTKDIKVRFQYNYSADWIRDLNFIGVGYLKVETLFKGFEPEEK